MYCPFCRHEDTLDNFRHSDGCPACGYALDNFYAPSQIISGTFTVPGTSLKVKSFLSSNPQNDNLSWVSSKADATDFGHTNEFFEQTINDTFPNLENSWEDRWD